MTAAIQFPEHRLRLVDDHVLDAAASAVRQSKDEARGRRPRKGRGMPAEVRIQELQVIRGVRMGHAERQQRIRAEQALRERLVAARAQRWQFFAAGALAGALVTALLLWGLLTIQHNQAVWHRSQMAQQEGDTHE